MGIEAALLERVADFELAAVVGEVPDLGDAPAEAGPLGLEVEGHVEVGEVVEEEGEVGVHVLDVGGGEEEKAD